MNRYKKYIRFFTIVNIILGLVVVFFLYKKFSHTQINKIDYQTKNLVLGGTVPLQVLVADTESKRVQGLSKSQPLKEGQGMLFLFDKPGKYGIWMKDMNYPIDIVWFDEHKEVVYFEQNISPQTYPKVFTPPVDALSVLELPAGFLEKHNLN